jgi:hypothetical protein
MSRADSGNNDKSCRLKLNSWKPVPIARLTLSRRQSLMVMACLLDELATNWSHVSRDSAAAVAEKLELWAVDRQLTGQGGLLVADVVRAGRKWRVRIDYLVSEGWLSQLPEFYDGEQWREANEE